MSTDTKLSAHFEKNLQFHFFYYSFTKPKKNSRYAHLNCLRAQNCPGAKILFGQIRLPDLHAEQN